MPSTLGVICDRNYLPGILCYHEQLERASCYTLMETVLDDIKQFADCAHGDQVRKYCADRYIVHPVRVMELCRTVTSEITILAAALLHDVLEDTKVTPDEMEAFLLKKMTPGEAEKTLGLVVELTDVFVKKNFPSMNRRERKQKEAERMALTSPGAQTIKYADIIDNSKEIVSNDLDFAQVFLKECRALLKKMNKGDKELYQQALDVVNGALAGLKGKPVT